MGDVIVDITMSLDGFVTARDPGPDAGLGVGGEPIHDWAIGGRTDVDQQILDDAVAATGAVLMGRNLYDVVDGPHGWTDEVGYGAARPQEGMAPIFVVTHEAPAPDQVRLVDRFRFATDGIDAAVATAREAAGDRHVVVMGGAGVIQSVLRAGLADELRIHLVPVLTGGGTRLFDDLGIDVTLLEQVEVLATTFATHLTYRFRP